MRVTTVLHDSTLPGGRWSRTAYYITLHCITFHHITLHDSRDLEEDGAAQRVRDRARAVVRE